MKRSLLLLAGCSVQLATAFTPSFADLTIKQSTKSQVTRINTLRSIQTLSNIAPRYNRWHTALSNTNTNEEEDDEEAEEEKKRVRDEIFWAKQRALAAEMSAKSDAGLKRLVLCFAVIVFIN